MRRRLESDTIQIPELKDLIGKDVEIVVSETASPERQPGPMAGSVLWDDSDPSEPAVDPDEWEANR